MELLALICVVFFLSKLNDAGIVATAVLFSAIILGYLFIVKDSKK